MACAPGTATAGWLGGHRAASIVPLPEESRCLCHAAGWLERPRCLCHAACCPERSRRVRTPRVGRMGRAVSARRVLPGGAAPPPHAAGWPEGPRRLQHATGWPERWPTSRPRHRDAPRPASVG